MNNLISNLYFTDEQQLFISKALEGHNILVDACIGSGKTTAIQQLCCEYPEDKKILYLTYNKLLKLDAKSKIKNKNATVTNYHGFAAKALIKAGIHVGISDMIQVFNAQKPAIEKYDVLVLDEYQDIELELALMLEYIKSTNPQMQLVAVGDMRQKIYDKTTLDVQEFVTDFLGEHITLEFTKCFRLSSSLAERLGRIWKKTIVGVNDNCIVEEMNVSQVVEFLAQQEPKDILCLGARRGKMTSTLNILESRYLEKFNKKTVYASISDRDGTGATEPKKTSAIFTTYDSSKGLERKNCIVFDYTEDYWANRVTRPEQSYEILRNIFCVAASRGKNRIIFVNNGEEMLSEETLSTEVVKKECFRDVNISDMFSFKYKENVEECYSLLDIKPLESVGETSEIHIKNNDELIDLSPCIGIYQEETFFDSHNIDKRLEFIKLFHNFNVSLENMSTEEKILFSTAIETGQNRYRTQVEMPLVQEAERLKIVQRLLTEFCGDEIVQKECSIDFSNEDGGEKLFSARGMIDVLKDNIVYELKFVSELMHEHFLQCACYVVALGLEKGILWNTRKNERYEITVPNKAAFLDAVANTITKTEIPRYHKPRMDCFAVIDTETTWSDKVMSIGVVIADCKTFEMVDAKYYIITPENNEGGMFSSAMYAGEDYPATLCVRESAISSIKELFAKNRVQSAFSYNASFDINHLPELAANLRWYDIMRLAAYKQYNKKIPRGAELCSSGRLKSNYGVEAMVRLLTGDHNYCETHNAVRDAVDELKIMQLLGQKLETYYLAGLCLPKREFTAKPTKTSSPRAAYSGSTAETMKPNHVQPPTQTYSSVPKRETATQTYGTAPRREVSRSTIKKTEEQITGYSTKQVSQILSVSISKVYQMIHDGVLPAKKVNHCYYVEKRDVEKYLEYLEEVERKRKTFTVFSLICAAVAIILMFSLMRG